MNIANLSPKKLRSAAKLKERLDRLTVELASLLGDSVNDPGAVRKRKRSPAARAAMAAAQRARWAKTRKSETATKTAVKPRRKFSRAARARMAAAAKARWAQAKAQGKKSL